MLFGKKQCARGVAVREVIYVASLFRLAFTIHSLNIQLPSNSFASCEHTQDSSTLVPIDVLLVQSLHACACFCRRRRTLHPAPLGTARAFV